MAVGVVMFCVGTYQRSLDDKHRFLLPKPVKLFLREAKSGYLTPGMDGCVELHNDDSLNRRASETERSSVSYSSKRSFARLFFSQSEPCELDGQGRIRIPVRLAELAGLDSRITLIGNGAFWEIWDQERWSRYLAERAERFDQSAGTMENPNQPR